MTLSNLSLQSVDESDLTFSINVTINLISEFDFKVDNTVYLIKVITAPGHIQLQELDSMFYNYFHSLVDKGTRLIMLKVPFSKKERLATSLETYINKFRAAVRNSHYASSKGPRSSIVLDKILHEFLLSKRFLNN